MTDRDQRIATAFERLLRTYQQSDRGDGDDVLRERMERAAVYFEAVAIYDVQDVEQAVTNFINGSALGVNPNFAPPAPAVAGEVRRVMNLRIEREARRKKPALPPPDVVRSPDSMARVAAMTQAAADELASIMRTEDAEADRRKQAFHSRVHARFDPLSEREIAERLGYTAGDPDGDDGDMGTRAA